MPPPGLIIVKSPIKLFSIPYRWVKRALYHVHIHKSKKKQYITFKSTKKKKKKRKGSAFPLPSSKRIYFCSIV